MAYSRIDPFGEERADIRNAILCQTVANAMGVKKQGGGELGIKDFMPEFDKDPHTPIDTEYWKNLFRDQYGNNS